MPASSELPLYLQISERLHRDICAGRYPVGGRLPPERQLAQQMQTAVGTLRKALETLEQQGLLTRRQGSGNYVARRDGGQGIYSFFHLERRDGDSAGLPTARVLAVDAAPAPAGFAGLDAATPCWRFRRLRFLDNIPVAVEEIWLRKTLAPDLDPSVLSEALYHSYARHFDLDITRVEDRLGVGCWPDWTPDALGHGTPALVERRAWDGMGQVAEVSRNWFDSRVAQFVSRQGAGLP